MPAPRPRGAHAMLATGQGDPHNWGEMWFKLTILHQPDVPASRGAHRPA